MSQAAQPDFKEYLQLSSPCGGPLSGRVRILTALCEAQSQSRVILRCMPSALQIKVLWQGRSPEWDELDGGAFAKWMQACEEEENQQRQIAAALGVKAAAYISSDSSQALPGLRPQVRRVEAIFCSRHASAGHVQSVCLWPHPKGNVAKRSCDCLRYSYVSLLCMRRLWWLGTTPNRLHMTLEERQQSWCAQHLAWDRH